MAITKRPKPGSPRLTTPEDNERQIEAFIAGAGSTLEPSLAAAAEPDARRARVMMRFDPALLGRIDAAAKRRGVSRTAWLHMVASRALDQGDG